MKRATKNRKPTTKTQLSLPTLGGLHFGRSGLLGVGLLGVV